MLPDTGEENGETFYQKAARLAMDFIDEKEVVLVNLSELDYLGKDVNEIGRENTLKLVKGTPLLTMETAMEIILN